MQYVHIHSVTFSELGYRHQTLTLIYLSNKNILEKYRKLEEWVGAFWRMKEPRELQRAGSKSHSNILSYLENPSQDIIFIIYDIQS